MANIDASAPITPGPGFTDTLAALLASRPLAVEQVASALDAMMAGQWHEAEIAAVLVAWHIKGETAAELAASASAVRSRMIRLDLGREDVLDTCGTGGDGLNTFNISTATALVAAAAGVPVVKHGNRAVSGKSGSADVLTALGVNIESDAEACRRCLAEAGLAFCHAPSFHPALRHVAGVRRRLGVRTLFNWIGPLCHPANAPYQLIGVGRPDLLDRYAEAVRQLGIRHALIVCGRDGLDEVSLSSETMVRSVRNGTIASWEWTAADFGLEPCKLEEIRADGPAASATIIRCVLEGREGPALRVVLANASAALLAAERVHTLAEGVAVATAAIRDGSALAALDKLARFSRPVDQESLPPSRP